MACPSDDFPSPRIPAPPTDPTERPTAGPETACLALCLWLLLVLVLLGLQQRCRPGVHSAIASGGVASQSVAPQSIAEYTTLPGPHSDGAPSVLQFMFARGRAAAGQDAPNVPMSASRTAQEAVEIQ